jgi:hypothetical protein
MRPHRRFECTHRLCLVDRRLVETTINHTIVGVEDLWMGFAAGGIMAAAYEFLFRIDSLQVPLGLVTPFQAFGADLVLSVPGCSRTDIPA